MLVLFTDYGWSDPYVGQMKAVLHTRAPGMPVVDLFHDVPDFNAHSGAQLLDALCPTFPEGAVFVCVVDPGVGSAREALVAEVDGHWFVGPDNGLLSIVAGRGRAARYWHIRWRPEGLSDTFHGRDLFAPVAARLATRESMDSWLETIPAPQVQFDLADLPRVLYIDHYGNAWTGIRGGLAGPEDYLEAAGQRLPWRRIFADAAKGEPFWHVNSNGLVEISANRGHAAGLLGLKVGDRVTLSGSPGSRSH